MTRKFSGNPVASTPLAGDEIVPGVQDGTDVQMTVDDILAPAVKTAGNQTIDGTKSFTAPVVVPTPTGANHAVTKAYADGLTTGGAVSGGVLDPVKVVATTNQAIGLLSGAPIIDGYQTVDGDRVLLTGQSSTTDNGPWLVGSLLGWSRPADFALGSSQAGMAVFVAGGNTYKGSAWVLSSTGTILVGTHAQTWVQDASAVRLTGNQTIGGTKTFSNAPFVPDNSWSISDTGGLQAALDGKAADNAVVKLTGPQTVAGVKSFSSSPVVPDASWAIAKTSGLQAALDAKAADAAVIKTTGNQTKTGILRFNEEPRYKSGPTYDPREWGSAGGDDALLINAASSEIYSNGLSGTVDLSGQDWNVDTPVLARLYVRLKGRQTGFGAGAGASPSRIIASPDFVGEAVIKSTSWDGTPDDWWHIGCIEDLVVDAGGLAGVIPYAIFQMGEHSILRRCAAFNYDGVGFHFAGYHAVGHLENLSSWGGSTGTYAYEFSSHPTIVKAPGGLVRAYGLSGDNALPGNTAGSMLGFINIEDGYLTLLADGIKAELHSTVLRVAGTSKANVVLRGHAIRQSPASGDFVKIAGTAKPTVKLEGAYGSQFTNVVNDTVAGRTLASPANAFIADVTWNSGADSSQTLVHHTQGHPVIRGTEDATPVLRVRRSSASMSAEIFRVEDESGNPLVEVLPDGRVLVSGDLAGSIVLRPDAANPSLQFEAAGVRKSQMISDGDGGVLFDAPSYYAIRDALDGGNYMFLAHAANGLTLSYAAGKIGEFGATPVTKSTGWGAPTGTATKTTFDTTTVTLPQLAERVKALIDYLSARGMLGA